MILQTHEIDVACRSLETEARYLKELADGFFKIGQQDTAEILDLRVKHIKRDVTKIRKAHEKQVASLAATMQEYKEVLLQLAEADGKLAKPASWPMNDKSKSANRIERECRYLPHNSICATCSHITVHESWEDQFKGTCDLTGSNSLSWPRVSPGFGELCDEYNEASNG